ncbi:MAG: hypothetical protein PVJ33_04680 [Lysobacterales bacterium]|jgi:hypothetical protein
MPRLKKTRTRSTSGHLRKLRQIRREVAAEAARIIATESQHNYHVAKKKAADRIGVSERLALPSNIEVQEALTAYQGLYGGTAHRENLEHLRRTAVEAMQWLERFNPRLVGPVLDGTAGSHSRISLHVFADSVEAVVLFFLERGTAYRQEQRQIRWFNGEHRLVPLIVVSLAGVDIELAVFEPVHLRQSPPSPIDGRPQRRAAVGEVEYLLEQQSA